MGLCEVEAPRILDQSTDMSWVIVRLSAEPAVLNVYEMWGHKNSF
jgi:hypothetical protein